MTQVLETCTGAHDGGIEELFEQLSAASRRARQVAAKALADEAKADPAGMAAYSERFVEALECPEAQTRWECLSALGSIVSVQLDVSQVVIDGAEFSLFDETNGPVRLAAFRFLCKVGETSPEASARVWPLLDEAYQCYHGDSEFAGMMSALAAFACTDIADEVREGMQDRLAFDAENGKGAVRRRARAILDSLETA